MNRREFSGNLLIALGAAALNRSLLARAPRLRVNGSRILDHLSGLAAFGKNPQRGVTRLAYSEADRQGRQYVLGLMRAAKLEATIDAAGNLVGRRPGRIQTLPPLVAGSHIDSVPDAGNYDGNVGSISAIEVAHTLADNDISTRHPLEIIIFQNEEGGLIGSRAISGELAGKELDLVSRSGRTIREGIQFIGGDPSGLESVRRKPGDIAAYVELHIEQGGILDTEKVDIGVVTGIVGIHWWDVTIEGFANHAGTTPMNQRRDALLAAGRFIDMVNRIVTSVPGRQVGTVGRIQALPGAPNVIPGKVIVSLELRDLEVARIEMLYQKVHAEAQQIGAATGTKFTFEEINVNVPALTSPHIQQHIIDSASELGLTMKLMPSGAGHDAQDMARLGPAGMIFVPSAGGISHSPDEFSRPAAIVNGANVLLLTLLKLDASGIGAASPEGPRAG